MKTKTVYRIEHRVYKIGPYNAYFHYINYHEDDTGMHPHFRRIIGHANVLANRFTPNYRMHPTVHSDFGGNFNERWLCAVESWDSLRYWFGDEELCRALYYAGFQVIEANVKSRCIKRGISGKQVIFKRDAIINYKTHSVLHICSR